MQEVPATRIDYISLNWKAMDGCLACLIPPVSALPRLFAMTWDPYDPDILHKEFEVVIAFRTISVSEGDIPPPSQLKVCPIMSRQSHLLSGSPAFVDGAAVHASRKVDLS